ncbi:hypothetical protein AARI_06290 [Glutamicibacter arilaitensis Re117]|uniref:Uncharacterized protein n=1 Tax=Glutamicibacter arilaitensis (strain DSM 16368 / CIP 108037 / IAM 15318 / JCM 13566 / NCIMB 14258 / Re117) TaxID=861360 RepID=A0ABP1U0I2_GLUAR|nr:hypothetical protein AARI_06290 [Glutamicibacter arilaitensis Re117]
MQGPETELGQSAAKIWAVITTCAIHLALEDCAEE